MPPDAAPVEVLVRWHKLPGSDRDVRQLARDIAETVLGEIQRRLDAPVLLTSAGERSIAQAAAPISYIEAKERFAGLEWVDPEGRRVRILSDRGGAVEREAPRHRRRRARFVAVSGEPSKQRQRTVHVRPGRGGWQPRPIETQLDALKGLEKYGEVVWWQVSAGAKLGVIELASEGNAIAWCRLSGDDQNETLDGQMRPILGLVGRSEELAVRYALLAVDMQGWREVDLEDLGLTPDQPNRDDVVQIDRWLKEGWLEHVVLRDQRRLARDTLPGEQIIRYLDKHDIGLWFADRGRIDFHNDRLQLRFNNIIAAEDRDNLNRQLQMGRVNKGPMLGKGWGNVPFGFFRDQGGNPRQDMEQWPYILRAFELADALGSERPGDFSLRKVTAQLAAEGCPFAPPTVGRILARKIYATGEWTVEVRGQTVAQEPIALRDPVPLDRFQRVQELMGLRRGGSKNTGLGECLLNLVEAVHARCMDENETRETPVRIKGYRDKKLADDVLIYRHKGGAVPTCCRSGGRNHRGGFSWRRDEIDRPLARELRRLATHPEVLRQAALAARHTNATTSTRLSDEQREALEAEAEGLSRQIDRLADQWVESAGRSGGDIDLAGFQRISASLQRKLKALHTRLENDAAAASVDSAAGNAKRHDRVNTFLEIMTEETPSDPYLRQLRGRLFQRVVSRVIIEDEGGDSPITLIIEGHLVPEDAPIEAGNPVLACADLLDAYEMSQAGEMPQAEAALAAAEKLRGEVRERSETVAEEASSATVSEFYDLIPTLPSGARLQVLERQTLRYPGWRTRSAHRRVAGIVSWRSTVEISPVQRASAPHTP